MFPVFSKKSNNSKHVTTTKTILLYSSFLVELTQHDDPASPEVAVVHRKKVDKGLKNGRINKIIDNFNKKILRKKKGSGWGQDYSSREVTGANRPKIFSNVHNKFAMKKSLYKIPRERVMKTKMSAKKLSMIGFKTSYN
jgi:hypothetical protein